MKGHTMDLKNLTDSDLDKLRRDVLNEQDRRANLDAIPEQVAALAKVYRDGGGDEQALQDALTPEELAALEAPGDPFDGGFDLDDVDEDTATH